jgi:hypothetical protein
MMGTRPLSDFFQPGCAQAERKGMFERDHREALAIEADFPGWEASVSVIGLWFAKAREPVQGYGAREYRPILGAGDPGGIRAAIESFGA